jgi:hypothetical protein
MGNTNATAAARAADPGVLTVSQKKAESIHPDIATLERLPPSRPIIPADGSLAGSSRFIQIQRY